MRHCGERRAGRTGRLTITKNSMTVTGEIELQAPDGNMGAGLVKQSATKANAAVVRAVGRNEKMPWFQVIRSYAVS